MDKVKIILENGSEAEVYSIFYLYNSKYYFIYTTGEIDQNGYVILHLVQVAKEFKNTPEGTIDTGYMVGVEISNLDEWKTVQASITEIVNDKKNNTKSDKIQYLPTTMLSILKIISNKTFRLMKSIVEKQFGLNLNMTQNLIDSSNNQPMIQDVLNDSKLLIDNTQNQTNDSSALLPTNPNQGQLSESFNNQIDTLNSVSTVYQEGVENLSTTSSDLLQDNVIIDYRTRFFEEQEKNKQLQLQINELNQKLESIKKVVE